MAFKLTYATMESARRTASGLRQSRRDAQAVFGKEYSMIIDNQDVFADEKWDDRSPVNTHWVLAKSKRAMCITPTSD